MRKIHYRPVRHCSSGCHADGLIRGDASLAQEISGAEQRNGCFPALFGEHAEPHPPFLNVEDSIRTLSLRKDDFFPAIAMNSLAEAGSR